MSNRTAIASCVALVLVAFAAGFLVYPQLPDPMPSHWDAAGNVDGYMSRTWAVALLPLITAVLALVLLAIPNLDPLRANIATFRGKYNAFVVGFVVFMVYVYALTLAAGLGYQFDITRLLTAALGPLFVGISGLLRAARRNFFIGIRTPWTLASDEIWDATHRLAARTFLVGGLLATVAALWGPFWLVMMCLLGAAFVPVGYSFLLWRRMGRPAPPR